MKLSDMPIRDFYALEALSGVLVAYPRARPDAQVCQAYGIADALLKFQNRTMSESDHKIAALTVRAERAETQNSLLLNMNEDGQFAARVALTQIWEALGVDNQTAAMQMLRDAFPGLVS